MSARGRIEALLDPGSFMEWGAGVLPAPPIVGDVPEDAQGDAVITGVGTIGGRPVYVFSQDYAVLEGTLGARGAAKLVTLLDRAADTGAPVVGLLHSNGARVAEGIGALEGANEVFQRMVVYRGRMPMIAVAMGFCAGFSAYLAALADLVVMVDRTSFLVTTSPAVITLATGQRVRLPELGGARMHAEVSGAAHFVAPSEEAALATVREALGYLDHGPPRPAVPPASPMPALPASPAVPYDVGKVVAALADGGAYLEVGARYARNVVTAFARLEGRPIGIVANQPLVESGAFTVKGARKMSRFMRVCDLSGVPIVFLVDVPGILPGVEPEREGILGEGAEFFHACLTEVPRIALVTRRCYGGAYALLQSKAGGGALVMAWPGARIGVVGGAIAQMLLLPEDATPEARAAMRAEWEARGETVEAAAGIGIVDRIVAPEDTRRAIADALALFARPAPGSRLRRSGWQ